MATHHLFGSTACGIHGEIVSWDIPNGTKVTHAALLAALDAAGFDRKVSRAMAPRNAFSRASGSLADKRIIRKLEDSEGFLKFQFTAEQKDATGSRLEYNYEAVLTLDKKTGIVHCPDSAALATAAQAAINAEMDIRYTNDITTIAGKLIAANADLFAIRQQGGCYFVPAVHIPFIDRIEQFLVAVGGGIRRFPVPIGTPSGDRSVSESVRDGLKWWVGQHEEAIAAFDASTRDSTLEKTVERINNTRFKLEAYSSFLIDQKDEIEAAIREAKRKLREKIRQMGRGVSVPEDASAEPLAIVEDNEPADEPVSEALVG
jgi:hypothetical protein